MNNGLIGYSGFVGGNLKTALSFDHCFNSQNIGQIKNQRFDTLVCSAPSAAKWLANKQPEVDLANIMGLIELLETVSCRKFVLVSTVDVFATPIGVTENDVPSTSEGTAYGKNRLTLENSLRKRFDDLLVLRLPGLFGRGLKKNPIYDLKHNNALHLLDHRSSMQFYDLSRLPSDLGVALDAGLRTLHLATEPITIGEIGRNVFNVDFLNESASGPVTYDLRTIHGGLFGKSAAYLDSKEETIARLRDFTSRELS
jgi:hypothetical protein